MTERLLKDAVSTHRQLHGRARVDGDPVRALVSPPDAGLQRRGERAPRLRMPARPVLGRRDVRPRPRPVHVSARRRALPRRTGEARPYTHKYACVRAHTCVHRCTRTHAHFLGRRSLPRGMSVTARKLICE